MPGPIHVFHQSERERAALERDLRSVAFDVRTFASGQALIAANEEGRPALVLWDMDVGRVRGGLAHLAQNLRCPIVGLTTDQSRPREEERTRTVLLPYERWRVTPLVLRVLSAVEAGAGGGDEGVIDTIRVHADTVRQSLFETFDALPETQLARRTAPTVPVPLSPPPLPVPEPPPLPVAAPPVAARVRVLLADDDDVLQHILGYQLACAGWDVVRAADGIEAQRIVTQPGGAPIDVLLVDLNLPHRNGFEILEHLQPEVNHPKLRVVVLSEQTQEDKIVRAFDLGAHDFVQKPLNPRVVVSRIARLLRSE